MTGRPARFKQSDLEKALRAAHTVGAGWTRVRVTTEGDIIIESLSSEAVETTPDKPVAAREDIKL